MKKPPIMGASLFLFAGGSSILFVNPRGQRSRVFGIEPDPHDCAKDRREAVATVLRILDRVIVEVFVDGDFDLLRFALRHCVRILARDADHDKRITS